jgi:hypothetical protein
MFPVPLSSIGVEAVKGWEYLSIQQNFRKPKLTVEWAKIPQEAARAKVDALPRRVKARIKTKSDSFQNPFGD